MSSTVFEKARTYLYRHARPLDLARFQYHFEQGSREAVMQVLSCYQNADGGLGHAVEADCWNPNSTPLHTATACGIIGEIAYPDAAHPVIQGILHYLSGGQDFNGKTWNLLVDSNNSYPHAPWWQTGSESTCHTDYNGTAELAGFLLYYAKPSSAAWQLGLRIAREAIDALSDAPLQDMHTCACYIHMAEWIQKAGATTFVDWQDLHQKLHEAVRRLIVSDPARWNSYTCKPSHFMNSEESEFFEEHRKTAELECEFLLNSQLDDGSWPIPWQWDEYPEEWAVSRNWWKGHVIVENLRYLKGLHRI